ncbi:efflux RND transporter permease subunit [bacterium]|nr:efflux RND transporter permease subunit [bacterium]MBU1074128.1 efflux RND transporter permease subunit [bacterium]MBU1676829.1 efflux RND transporter permease subunit [bacterium]
MKITNGAIRRYPTIFAFMVIIVIVGVDSYLGLPRESSPDVKIPIVMVMTPYAGASPEDVESLVTRKLERELKGLSNLKEMTSTSVEGMSNIVLEFTTDVEMSDALQKVRDRVDLAKPDLPEDPREDLLIMELSSTDWPIIQINLAADYDPILLKEVGEDLQEEIETVRGVLEVNLTGGVEHEVLVQVDPQRLRFYNLGLVDVQDAIFLQNTTIPGGKLSLGMYDYQVNVPGEIDDVSEILDFVVNLGAPTPVYIRDVAEVSFGLKDRETISRVNGKDAVILSVKKRGGENIIDIADEIRAILTAWQERFPPGTEITIVGDQSKDIRHMVTELENNIISGLILVVAVLLLFLGFTNALFVGVAIPFSLLISFIVLRALGITLNMVVLFSLILALGMLVDNAIVIVENIFRQRGRGKSGDEAARFGAAQVSNAVVASTLTTVCAFGPMILWPGIMGEFMKYLPITVVITLLASLLVALVFNPVLCARFMKAPRVREGRPALGERLIGFGLKTYEPTLRWALGHRTGVLTTMVALLICVSMLFAVFNNGVELFPDIDPRIAYVAIDAPSGTRIEVSDVYTRQVEAAVAEVPELKAYTGQVGAENGAFSANQAPSHKSLVTMEFVDIEDRTRPSRGSVEDLRRRLSGFTGARLVIDKQEEGPPTGPPVNIEISGEDFNVLGELAAQVSERIRNVEGLVDIVDDYDRDLPQIEVRQDVDKAGRFGLRTWDIAGTVRTALHGAETSKFRVGEDEYDIRVRLQQPFRRKVEDLESLHVFYEGEQVPLAAFATTEFKSGLAAINRIDSKRVVSVSADVAAGYNSNALLAEVRELLADFHLPVGYSIDYTGETEDQEEAQAFLSDAFAIAIMLIFVVLISQFSSVTVPLVILSSVALSLIGVLTGLMVHRTPFGIIMTGVGVISLAGIVVNNSIVLLDYIIQLRARGIAKTEAIVRAGLTRFRPVILTAVTTILGLIPLTTGVSVNFANIFKADWHHILSIGGESSQWWSPMGIAVIWGLAVATFLTLIVVPVMYSSLDPFKRGLRAVFLGWWLDRVRSGEAAEPGA